MSQDLIAFVESLNIEGRRYFIKRCLAHATAAAEEIGETPMEPKHYFSKGVYARELFIPKGTLVVGKIHRHQNLNILSSGDLTVISIEGVQRVKPPFTVVSPPGVQRVVYAHEDSIWTTIHGTDEKDVQKIEDEFIVKSYEELEMKENLCLGHS